MNMEEQLRTVVSGATTDAGLWHNIVHGTDTQTIGTENGEVPSVAKQLKDVRDAIMGGVVDVISRAENARDDAITAKDEVFLLQETFESLKSETQEFRDEAETLKDLSQTTFNNVATATSTALVTIREESVTQIEAIHAQTVDGINLIKTEGATQIASATNEADRAATQANLVNFPLVARDENEGNVAINWSLQEDYLFYLTGNATLSFENLPENDNFGWFKLLVFSITNTPTLTVPSNFMYVDDTAPVLKAGKCYQFAIQYIYAINKFFVSVVEY